MLVQLLWIWPKLHGNPDIRRDASRKCCRRTIVTWWRKANALELQSLYNLCQCPDLSSLCKYIKSSWMVKSPNLLTLKACTGLNRTCPLIVWLSSEHLVSHSITHPSRPPTKYDHKPQPVLRCFSLCSNILGENLCLATGSSWGACL